MTRFLTWTLALLAVAVASYFTVYRGRVYYGVRAASYDLSGLTAAQAADLLRREAAPALARQTLTLRSGPRLWAPTYADLGARLDAPATAAAAARVGREGPLGPLRALLVFVRPVSVPPVVVLDPPTFNAYLARLASDTYIAPRDASVAIAGTTTYAVPAQAGRRLDVPAFVATLRAVISPGAVGTLELPLTDTAAQVGDSAEAAQQAARLISAPLTLVYAERAWTLKPSDLETMLVYRLDEAGRLAADLDKPRLQAWVARLSPEIDRPAQEAQLRWDAAARRPVVARAGQAGRNLDVFATTDRLLDATRASLRAATPPVTERRAEAVVGQRRPAVDGEQLDSLGIRELVWEETSYFQGSAAGRVHNIRLAAARFDGVVIPPDGVFSFNAIVGEISAAAGYDETLVILDNQTRRGPGGGVCQVSTTIFRAAFWAGFPFLERASHAYRVSYYEQGGKPIGLEAAIFTPDVDLRFRNDSGAHLLMHTAVNPNGGSLTVRLYGTKPARDVSLDGPRVSDRQPPGPPVYEEDATLAAGQQRQVEEAREGMSIEYERVVKQGGQVVRRERFTSDYVPTQARFKVGKRS